MMNIIVIAIIIILIIIVSMLMVHLLIIMNIMTFLLMIVFDFVCPPPLVSFCDLRFYCFIGNKCRSFLFRFTVVSFAGPVFLYLCFFRPIIVETCWTGLLYHWLQPVFGETCFLHLNRPVPSCRRSQYMVFSSSGFFSRTIHLVRLFVGSQARSPQTTFHFCWVGSLIAFEIFHCAWRPIFHRFLSWDRDGSLPGVLAFKRDPGPHATLPTCSCSKRIGWQPPVPL